jgi:hypothetical protein
MGSTKSGVRSTCFPNNLDLLLNWFSVGVNPESVIAKTTDCIAGVKVVGTEFANYIYEYRQKKMMVDPM